jgi:hypothetical protein
LQIRVLPRAQEERPQEGRFSFKVADLYKGGDIPVLPEASSRIIPEQLSKNEQFLDLVRFDQRSKLDELPDDWNAPERSEGGWKRLVGMFFLSSRESPFPDTSGIITDKYITVHAAAR